MIHLALEVLAFLFLCWVGLIVLGIVAAIFEGGGHPNTVRENQQQRDREIETVQRDTQYQMEPTPASFQHRELSSDELERARETLHKREAQRWEAQAAKEREAAQRRESEAEANRTRWIH